MQLLLATWLACSPRSVRLARCDFARDRTVTRRAPVTVTVALDAMNRRTCVNVRA